MEISARVPEMVHQATVVGVDARASKVRVRVDSEGECAGCAAAAICGAGKPAGSGAGILSIGSPLARTLKPGDRVEIAGEERLQRKAMMLVTVLPCIILIAVMVTVFLLTLSQGTAALAGLGSMVFFFIALYLFRNNIRHEFQFKIVKKL